MVYIICYKNDLVMLKVSRACMYITKYIYMDICTYLSIHTGSSNIRILIKLVNRFSRNSCKLLELLFKKLVPIPPPQKK